MKWLPRRSKDPVENAENLSALERVNPRGMWTWAIVVALAGIAVRVIWFVQFRDDLANAYGHLATGHYWGAGVKFSAAASGEIPMNDLARAFAPGYGLLLKAITDWAGGATLTAGTVSTILLIIQSIAMGLATLLTFALSRRVLFGWLALAPAVLLNLSVAGLELAGGIAPGIITLFLLALAVWLVVILKEHIQHEDTGRHDSKALLLAVAAGFSIGAAVLFDPAVILFALPAIWWSFRGLGRDYATLFLVAVVLLPASWLAVVKAEAASGIPVDAAKAWAQTDAGNVTSSPSDALDRAYAVATPWNPRFARGDFESKNWNWEWLIPDSVRSDTTYISATRAVFIVIIIGYILLIAMGLIELFAEGAGSVARLIGLPILTLPLATFIAPGGNILRLPILPFTAIALTLGFVWLTENLRPYTRERRAKERGSWT